ncbi:hypothetical protein MMC24_003431 [Lignoscripta atroalba]|nr:hypothetical protein [Lignoscripta atroalba]
MATIMLYRIDTRTYESSMNPSKVVTQIKHIEKKTFPRNEALDFDSELKKRNTCLLAIVDDNETDPFTGDPQVVSYMVYARIRGIVLLHKICTAEKYRQQGNAQNLLLLLLKNIRDQGFQTVQLWVDGERDPARCLYNSMAYKEVQRVEDYYGPGRAGVKMVYNIECLP